MLISVGTRCADKEAYHQCGTRCADKEVYRQCGTRCTDKGEEGQGTKQNKTEHLREDTPFQHDRMAVCLNIHGFIP